MYHLFQLFFSDLILLFFITWLTICNYYTLRCSPFEAEGVWLFYVFPPVIRN